MAEIRSLLLKMVNVHVTGRDSMGDYEQKRFIASQQTISRRSDCRTLQWEYAPSFLHISSPVLYLFSYCSEVKKKIHLSINVQNIWNIYLGGSHDLWPRTSFLDPNFPASFCSTQCISKEMKVGIHNVWIRGPSWKWGRMQLFVAGNLGNVVSNKYQ